MARHEKQRRKVPNEDDIKDGITFDKLGRMNYHPEFHPNHGKPFTMFDLIYICKYYEIDGPRKISFAIGKTELTIMGKVSLLRKSGEYARLRSISEDEWLSWCETAEAI